MNLKELEAYIRQAATARSIDPDIAVKVARSEGLAPGVWQANYVKNGFREPSYGPFQLLVGGPGTGFPTGLGNEFKRRTGLDPSDRSTVKQQIDFALDNAAKSGWGQWYGAAKVGVGKWDGLRGARSVGVSPSGVPLPAEAPVPVMASRAGDLPSLATAYAAPTPTSNPFEGMLQLASLTGPAPREAEAASVNAMNRDPAGIEALLADAMGGAPAAPAAAPVTPVAPAAREAENASMSALRRDPAGIEALLADRVVPPPSAPAAPAAPTPERFGDAPPLGEPVTVTDLPAFSAGDPADVDVWTVMQNPNLSDAAGLNFVDQTPMPVLAREDLTFFDGGMQNPAGPVLTGDGIDTFTARPMPQPMGPQGPQGPVNPAGPNPNIAPMNAAGNIALPATAPTPTPAPAAPTPGINWMGALGALGGILAALDQGSPELKPVSLPGVLHKPQFTGLPMPRGLL